MGKHRKKIGAVILCLIFFPFQNFLYGGDDASEPGLDDEFLKNLTSDFTGVLVSPKNWQKKELLQLSAVLGTGALLFAFDGDIQEWVQAERSPSSDDIAKMMSHLGDGGVLIGLMTALYASGEIFDSSSLRKTALLSLESWLTAGFVVTSLKFVAGRARPGISESSRTLHPFSFRSRYTSFPSGHSVSAFAVATSIACQSRKTYVDILAYSLASAVALSRVHNNEHWASDVFIGSSLGYFIARKIYFLDKNRSLNKLNVGFQFSAQNRSLALSLSF